MHEGELIVFLPRGQFNGLGSDELYHPLGRTLDVQVGSHRGVARDGPAREHFCCVEQHRQPRVDQPPIDARGARTLRAFVGAEGVPPEGGCHFQVRVQQLADQDGRND